MHALRNRALTLGSSFSDSDIPRLVRSTTNQMRPSEGEHDDRPRHGVLDQLVSALRVTLDELEGAISANV
jgi:hypothetical protein